MSEKPTVKVDSTPDPRMSPVKVYMRDGDENQYAYTFGPEYPVETWDEQLGQWVLITDPDKWTFIGYLPYSE